MSRPSARQKIESAALERFKKHGFHATGVEQILRDAGVSKGSFYHSFKSKEELGLVTLELAHQERVEALRNGAYQALEDPVERLLGFIDHCAALVPELWCDGCLLSSYANSMASVSPAYSERLSQLDAAGVDEMTAAFEPAVAAMRPGAPEARVLAETFMALLQGAISRGQSYQDMTVAQRTLRGFKDVIRALT